MELFLIRHAQSQNNALPESRRVEDPGLTELGQQQAELLGEWIPQLKLTKLFTSPFRRTLQTTEPIRKATSLTPLVKTELHEQGGCYRGHTLDSMRGAPGMNRAEIEETFSGYEVVSDFEGQGWWGSKPFENTRVARRRAGELLKWTQEEFSHTNERVAYVMHADIKVFFLEHIYSVPLSGPYNTSVTSLEITPDETRLVDFNRVGHLTNKLLTL